MDEYLKSELALFISHSNLAQLLVTAVMIPKFLQLYCKPIIDILTVDLNQGPFEAFRKAYLPFIFPFLWNNREVHMVKYHILLSDFLGDPMRSHEFHIEGNKFASLATAFTKYLFQPSM